MTRKEIAHRLKNIAECVDLGIAIEIDVITNLANALNILQEKEILDSLFNGIMSEIDIS